MGSNEFVAAASASATVTSAADLALQPHHLLVHVTAISGQYVAADEMATHRAQFKAHGMGLHNRRPEHHQDARVPAQGEPYELAQAVDLPIDVPRTRTGALGLGALHRAFGGTEEDLLCALDKNRRFVLVFSSGQTRAVGSGSHLDQENRVLWQVHLRAQFLRHRAQLLMLGAAEAAPRPLAL